MKEGNMGYCAFCRIADGAANTRFLFEDDRVVAFHDINPQAPTHVLVIPRYHYESIKEVTDEGLIGHLFTAAKEVAKKLGLTDYRLVINTGPQAGQSVFHLHLHLLGGRIMSWPPG
ncbi:MAG: histidine triad nucleotide-binding protein [Candidatus Aminicenantes bacterium]|nr:MAG: histidine triad nucleotide-binding protein [Candidatus Aminicenantes bacterium]